MNGQSRSEAKAVDGLDGQVSPNYDAWEGIAEAPKSVLVEFFRFLGQRTFYEVTIIGSIAALTYLAGRIISGGGESLPPPQGSFCLMAIVSMIFAAPILHHFYRTVSGSWSNAQDPQQSQDPPEPRDERAGPDDARRTPSED